MNIMEVQDWAEHQEVLDQVENIRIKWKCRTVGLTGANGSSDSGTSGSAGPGGNIRIKWKCRSSGLQWC
jgi:hypothetical protein